MNKLKDITALILSPFRQKKEHIIKEKPRESIDYEFLLDRNSDSSDLEEIRKAILLDPWSLGTTIFTKSTDDEGITWLKIIFKVLSYQRGVEIESKVRLKFQV